MGLYTSIETCSSSISDNLPLHVKRLIPTNSSDLLCVRGALLAYMNSTFLRYYPKFDIWYRYHIIKGFLEENRIIHVVTDNQALYGVSILKISSEVKSSNKICSFYISPEMRCKGFGSLLMKRTIEGVGDFDSSLVITVPEERVSSGNFSDFLEAFNFSLISEIVGKYRLDKKEYIYIRMP